MRVSRFFAAPAIVMLCALPTSTPAAAKISIVPQSRGGPPVTIGGFSYSFTPQRIHMNICDTDICGLGSKVSYVFYPAQPGLTFEAWKAQRKVIEKELKAHLPARAVFKVRPPTQSKDKVFSIFESKRTVTMPDGQTQVTISQLLLTKAMSIELISSGKEEKQVEINLALFMIGTMSIAISKDEAKP